MITKFHRMHMPREILIGDDAIEYTSEVCRKLGFERSAFVVSGPKTFKVLGKTVLEFLQDSKFVTELHIAHSVNSREVEAVKEKASSRNPEVVIGVGGGSKIDLAKYVAADLDLPFISIPSSASHDGIASPVASIESFGRPYSTMTRSPMAIIVDTEVIVKAPYRLIASGCGDVLAKFTAVRDWRLAKKACNEYYGGYAASLAELGARHVVENSALIQPNNKEGLRILLEALISCGVAMGIAGSSRPCSGSEHLFSHALKTLTNPSPLHGESCGVGTILMAYLHGIDWRRIKKTLKIVGAPTNSEELNVDPEIIVKALLSAGKIRPERYTILDEKKLSYDEAEKMAAATGVI